MINKNNIKNSLEVSKPVYTIKGSYYSKNFFWKSGEDINTFHNIVTDEKYDLNNTNHKILLYEDKVNGWFLEVGDYLRENKHADFVLLMISLSYIEGVAQFEQGKISEGQSKDMFREHLKKIFNLNKMTEEEVTKTANRIYKSGRCGLFHDGFSRDLFNISRDFNFAIGYDENQDIVLINPLFFFNSIKEHFEKYIGWLKNEKNIILRNNFEKVWDSLFNRNRKN